MELAELRLPTRERAPTRQQLACLRAYLEEGNQKAAAAKLGISYQTLKNHLAELYIRLDASGAIEAAGELGYISVPVDGPRPCGWIGYCSRPHGHRGHHGGFRAPELADS